MDNKGKGIIAYIFGWLGGLIVLLAFKDNDKKITIHACQAIVISVLVIIINIIYGIIPISIPFFSTVIYGLDVALCVMGIVKVFKDEDPELPVVGGIAKSIFAKKINEAPDVVNSESKAETTQTTEVPQQPSEPENNSENQNQQ